MNTTQMASSWKHNVRMDKHEHSSQPLDLNQVDGSRKMPPIKNMPRAMPFPLMQCPELSKMGLVFPEYLTELTNTIEQCEKPHPPLTNNPTINDILMASVNKSNISQYSMAEANILNIREPICPGNLIKNVKI